MRPWVRAKKLREWCRKALAEDAPILKVCELNRAADEAYAKLDEDGKGKYAAWALYGVEAR